MLRARPGGTAQSSVGDPGDDHLVKGGHVNLQSSNSRELNSRLFFLVNPRLSVVPLPPTYRRLDYSWKATILTYRAAAVASEQATQRLHWSPLTQHERLICRHASACAVGYTPPSLPAMCLAQPSSCNWKSPAIVSHIRQAFLLEHHRRHTRQRSQGSE